jgi:riboflavin synthase
MFTGIIESLGTIEAIQKDGTNYTFTIKSNLSKSLKIDQSLAHNGVCLTIVHQDEFSHQVIAIDDTMVKTNLGDWQKNDTINLERAMLLSDRLDGHIVQGHVDAKANVEEILNQDGSWKITLSYPSEFKVLLIEKGSICLNGISLTCFNLLENTFQVAIIPYTYENTNIKNWNINSKVNIEFDLLGKYLNRRMQLG